MKNKRIDRKALTEAIRNILDEQISEARIAATNKYKNEMEMDERVLVLRSLIEVHPSLKEILEKSISDLKTTESYAALKDMKYNWVDSNKAEIIRARLELMTDTVLQSLTVEELASIVKD